MSLEIGNYDFEGPYSSPTQLDERPGVFIVFCCTEDHYKGLDCGIANQVRDAVDTHPRREEWAEICQGEIQYAVLYTETNLPAIEERLRELFKFPCRDAAELAMA